MLSSRNINYTNLLYTSNIKQNILYKKYVNNINIVEESLSVKRQRIEKENVNIN